MLEFNPSEDEVLVFDLITGAGLAAEEATQVLYWLEDQVSAIEPIPAIAPTPERLRAARVALAAYGFALLEHPWAGPPFFEIHYPASAIPIVCGYANPMNIEDVERFLVTYAPKRSEWHTVYHFPDDTADGS